MSGKDKLTNPDTKKINSEKKEIKDPKGYATFGEEKIFYGDNNASPNPNTDTKKTKLEEAVAILHALSHSTRMSIVNLLYKHSQENKKDPIIVWDVYNNLNIEQSLASDFISLLHEAWLVTKNKVKKQVYLSLDHNTIDKIKNIITAFGKEEEERLDKQPK